MRAHFHGPFRRALVIVVLVAAAVTAFFVYKRRDLQVDSLVTSIAVLPFDIEAAGPGADFLAAGLSADLLDRLQSIGELQCIPRVDILAQSIKGQDWRKLSRQLGAEIMISGTLHESSGRIRVSVEILDSRDGKLIGNPTLEESRDRILELHKRLGHEVLAYLPITLSREQRARVDRAATRSLKAWDAFAQGTRYLDNLVNPRAPTFASELLLRSVELDPNFAQARTNLSTALWLEFMHQGNPDRLREAEFQARHAMTDRPGSSSAAVALALAVQTRTRSQETRSMHLAELGALTKPDEVARELASSWLRVGELELAESAFLAALEIAPDYWLNAYGYGQFLLRGGRRDEAVSAFMRAAGINPGTVTWPQENIVALRLASGDLSGAADVFETIQSPLTGADLVKQMAAAYSILGRLEPAEGLYRQAIVLSPHDPKIRQELGDVLTRSGRMAEAANEYTEALAMLENDVESDPSDSTRQRYLSLFAAKTGQCARASPLAATLLRHLPQSAEAAHELARVFAICKDETMALEALAEAIRIGLSPELVRSQSEFDWLSASEEFERILANAETAPPSP